MPRLAILPPAIRWEAPRRVRPGEIATEEGLLAADFQGMVYDWLAYWCRRRKRPFNVQRPDSTNLLLDAMGFFDGEVTLTDAELATALGVDVLLWGDCALAHPGNGAWAIVTATLLGTAIADSQWTISLQLSAAEPTPYDWHYERRPVSMGVETPVDLLRRELRRAVKRMPYFEK